jgi:hypothetical protein
VSALRSGDRAEIVGSESVFVTVLTGPGDMDQYLVKYETGGTVLRQGWQLRSLDASLSHHYQALRTLSGLLDADKLARALDYVAPHVKRAADALTPTTDKEAS